MSTMEYNTMFGVSSVYRDGGVRGRAKYQISEDEKCQNPFAGNPATLPAPRPDSGQLTNVSLSVRRRNKLVTCDAIHCNV